jgi:flagellar motor switch/type III secretory pathway protein FliN
MAEAGSALSAVAVTEAGRVESAWARVANLPCDVAVLLPAPGLRVRDLLGIAPGFVVRTTAPVSSDVPLEVNGQVIAWCEFEVVHDRLGVRLTELA